MASLRRTEAKAFFANERTFLHWMNMSVTLGSISAALLGVSGVAHKKWSGEALQNVIFVRVVALITMCLSIFMAIYAAVNFKLRGDMLQQKMDGPYDSRVLPVLLAAILIVALLLVFGGAIAQLVGA
eukprot:jgi/Botrbrau1/12847/Bobra.0045s0016.1